MAYIGKSIKEIMNMIGENKMFLPSIQRKYVWKDYDAEKLMDSIMLGYPIGTFLFWRLKRVDVVKNKYTLYKFINQYSLSDNKNINEKAPDNMPGESEYVFSVLDGQQRLTSLYIAFHGSLTQKKRGKSGKYITKEMYLNLNKDPMQKADEDDLKYEFKFLAQEEIDKYKDDNLDKDWFKIKDILKFQDINELIKFCIDNKLNTTAVNNLTKLFNISNNKDSNSIINYFEIDENTSFDTVLNIFIRVNDGGKKLSKSDLLFSTVVSNWEKGRQEIEELINLINKKGQRFDFDNDFIMRSCLYLINSSSDLKIENLGKDNIELIQNKWNKIKQSIVSAVDVLVQFGFCSENLISRNVVIPLVYYIYNKGLLDAESKRELRRYLIVSQIKQLFGASGNSTLTKIKKAIDEHKISKEGFRLNYFDNLTFTGQRNFTINAEDIERMLNYEKGSSYTFMILSLLYPEIKMEQVEWHQDHMHPQTQFKTSNLNKLGLDSKQIEEWKVNCNKLPNLQLLEGKENESKNKTSLEDWLKKNNAKYLPSKISYKLNNFSQFFSKRKKIIKKQLEIIFGLTTK